MSFIYQQKKIGYSYICRKVGYSGSYLVDLELQIFFLINLVAIAFLCYFRNIEAIDFWLKWQFECKVLSTFSNLNN